MGVLPCGMANFGGDRQVYTIDPELFEGSRVSLWFNPIAQNMFRTNYAPDYGLGLGGSTGVPSQGEVDDYFNTQLGDPYINKKLSARIDNCERNIAIMKTRLKGQLENKELSDDDKTAINKALEDLEAAEEKIKNLKKSAEETSQDDAKAEVAEIEQTIADVQKATKNIGRTSSGDDDSSVDKTDKSKKSKKSEKADETDKTDKTKKNEKSKEKQGGSKTSYSDEAFDLVEKFYNATYCAGTNDPDFEFVCENIREDNVLDVMLAWKDLHSAEKNESFMTTFMRDADSGFLGIGMDSGQKVKYGKLIKLALMKKARELDIMDNCRADFAEIDKEMGSWVAVDNDVAKNYDNIIKKIAEKEGKEYDTSGFKYGF